MERLRHNAVNQPPTQEVGCICLVYAQHGHELMGCESPVGEPKLIHDGSMLTTSRRQGQTREGMSEGSPSAKLRAYEQKRHRRPSRRGELAQDNETQGFARYGKWRGCAATVHVLIWGDLPEVRCILHSVGVSNDIGDQVEVSRGHSSWRS